MGSGKNDVYLRVRNWCDLGSNQTLEFTLMT